jgi:4-hydroxy-tetrahydrodipicolinate synthase
MEVNTASDLKGLWAAVPTPWDKDGKVALDVLERNVARYVDIPLDGVYTTDSDGEFYALELEEFRLLAKAFSRAISQTRMTAAMGVTWSHTQGIIDRMKAGLDCGINAFHIAFPFWMPMSSSDHEHFWEDLARAVPEGRWIHYNTPRGHRVLKGKDYARLAAQYPEQMIGSKIGSINLFDIVDCISSSPQLAHLTVDYMTVPAMMVGAAGTCSYWANTLPRWTRKMTDLCIQKEWEEAMGMQNFLLIWEARYVAPLREAGHLHGIVGKARGALTGFLEDSGYTKPPYYPVPENLMHELQEAFDVYWKDYR